MCWTGIENHGPYYAGGGVPTVDNEDSLVPFQNMAPPVFTPPLAVGSTAPGTFISEFGTVAMSSAESMNTLLSLDQRHFSSSAMYQVFAM